MRNPLSKRYIRQLRSNAGKYLGMFALMLLAVAFTGGYLLVANSMEAILNGMDETYKMEDGRFVCDFEASDEAIRAVEDLGVTVYPDFYRQVPLELSEADERSAEAMWRNFPGFAGSVYDRSGSRPQAETYLSAYSGTESEALRPSYDTAADDRAGQLLEALLGASSYGGSTGSSCVFSTSTSTWLMWICGPQTARGWRAFTSIKMRLAFSSMATE